MPSANSSLASKAELHNPAFSFGSFASTRLRDKRPQLVWLTFCSGGHFRTLAGLHKVKEEEEPCSLPASYVTPSPAYAKNVPSSSPLFDLLPPREK